MELRFCLAGSGSPAAIGSNIAKVQQLRIIMASSQRVMRQLCGGGWSPKYSGGGGRRREDTTIARLWVRKT